MSQKKTLQKKMLQKKMLQNSVTQLNLILIFSRLQRIAPHTWHALSPALPAAAVACTFTDKETFTSKTTNTAIDINHTKFLDFYQNDLPLKSLHPPLLLQLYLHFGFLGHLEEEKTISFINCI